MAFFEHQFPPEISVRAEGGPRFPNEVAYIGGRRLVLVQGPYPRHEYVISHPWKTAAEFQLIRNFAYVVGMNARAFRFKDWLDYEATQGDSALNVVSGNVYQLFRLYTFGTESFVRRIRKPVPGTVQVFRTRATVVSNATADCTVDHTTGLVTVANHVANDTYTWTGEFDVPVAFKDSKALWRALASSNQWLEWTDIELEEDLLA